MREKHLDRQIERIADEAEDSVMSVIVQMEPPDDLGEYLRDSAEAIGKRRTAASARDLLPPARQQLKVGARGQISPAAAKRLEAAGAAGAGPFLASQAIRPRAKEELRELGLNALKPLLESEWVAGLSTGKSSAIRKRAVKPNGAERALPVHFPFSASAVLNLTKDQLKHLAKEVQGIADIFPNRPVRLPPVSKATAPPKAVDDHKANAWGLAKTGALAAWGAFGARGKGALVAVLDTGVDPDHPDLKGKIAGFAEFDQEGRLVTDKLADAYDSGQHGTHCAGTIVGGDASGRWIGMAPEAKILAGLVLKEGVGQDWQIMAGMEWAIGREAQVISMSLGGLRLTPDVLDTFTRTIINANRLGIPVVVSVGNDGSQTSGPPGSDCFAFAVGATDADDWAAGFSGGRTQVVTASRYIRAEHLPLVYSKPEVSAPGVDIYSSVPGGKWEAWSGTSMAAPHVAGAMALLLGEPGNLAQQVGFQRVNLLQALLIGSVKELGEVGQNHRFGHGRIDVLRALGYARELGYL